MQQACIEFTKTCKSSRSAFFAHICKNATKVSMYYNEYAKYQVLGVAWPPGSTAAGAGLYAWAAIIIIQASSDKGFRLELGVFWISNLSQFEVVPLRF